MRTKVIGSGLICLDIIYQKNSFNNAKYTIGGSCGNVLSIISYLNCDSYPILPHNKEDLTYNLMLEEFDYLNIKKDLMLESSSYSIPIIIQENINRSHRFIFKNPFQEKFLPKYKSLNNILIEEIKQTNIIPNFFYFDRCNLSNLELARYYKNQGALIFFEPSKISYENLFIECLQLTDIVKYSQDRFENIDKYITKNIPVEIKTLGKNGLQFRINNDSWIQQDAKRVKNIIDTSGCGDMCSAGLICYLKDKQELSQENIFKGLEIGQTMSAINCTVMGAKTLLNYIDKNDFHSLIISLLNEKTVVAPDFKKCNQNYNLNAEDFLKKI